MHVLKSIKKIGLKTTKKLWRRHFPNYKYIEDIFRRSMADNSIVGDPNWPKFELFLDRHSSSYVCHHDLDSWMNSKTHPYIQRHISHVNYCYTSNHTLIGRARYPVSVGRVVF